MLNDFDVRRADLRDRYVQKKITSREYEDQLDFLENEERLYYKAGRINREGWGAVIIVMYFLLGAGVYFKLWK